MKPSAAIVLLLVTMSMPAGSEADTTSRPKPLQAPTYYIAVSAQYLDQNIKFRGASNLPPGAGISIDVGETENDGWKFYGNSFCVRLDDKGFFSGEATPKSETRFLPGKLFLLAGFRTNQCQQPAGVLTVVGRKGQYLGNDNYDDSKNVSMGQTEGMVNNPQLGQTSGWYFGLSAIARVGR